MKDESFLTPRDIAFGKLKALVNGAKIVRGEMR